MTPASAISQALAALWTTKSVQGGTTARSLEEAVGPLRLVEADHGQLPPYAILDLSGGFERTFRSVNADGDSRKVRVGYKGPVPIYLYEKGATKAAAKAAIVNAVLAEGNPGFTLPTGVELMNWRLTTDLHMMDDEKDAWLLQYEAALAIVSIRGGESQ